jgi:hypothetical protein
VPDVVSLFVCKTTSDRHERYEIIARQFSDNECAKSSKVLALTWSSVDNNIVIFNLTLDTTELSTPEVEATSENETFSSCSNDSLPEGTRQVDRNVPNDIDSFPSLCGLNQTIKSSVSDHV